MIRVSTAAGFARLRALLIEYEASLPPALQHGAVAGSQELREAYADPNAAFLALAGEQPAGCVVLERLDASVTVMKRLYISPPYRRRGLARALVLRACDFARHAGFDRVALDTDKETLPDAYALYSALGFAECPPYAPVAYANATFLELRLQ